MIVVVVVVGGWVRGGDDAGDGDANGAGHVSPALACQGAPSQQSIGQRTTPWVKRRQVGKRTSWHPCWP